MDNELLKLYLDAGQKENLNKLNYFNNFQEQLIQEIKQKLTDKNFKQFPFSFKFKFISDLKLTDEERLNFTLKFSKYLTDNKINNKIEYVEADSRCYIEEHIYITIKAPLE